MAYVCALSAWSACACAHSICTHPHIQQEHRDQQAKFSPSLQFFLLLYTGLK